MKWIFSLVCIGGAVRYAVVLGRAIEAGTPWAIEVAKADSALDSTHGEWVMRDIPANPQPAGTDNQKINREAASLAA